HQALKEAWSFSTEFVIRESTEAKMVLAIGNTALLSIFFKDKGKVSFLAQGKDIKTAEEFAVKLINSAWGMSMSVEHNPFQAFKKLYEDGAIINKPTGVQLGSETPINYNGTLKPTIVLSDKAPWEE
ncbi:MAG TPA: hypothetical protein VM577_07100, partial [Anaerovoracaceae bacterium]|nr:hypothetical protein [Anaerovoracaceae bacterium]